MKPRINFRIILVIFSIIILFAIILAGLVMTANLDNDEEQELKKAEEEFNNSGRAKAILEETDLWQIYENQEVGFSIKYPHDTDLDDKKTLNPYRLSIDVDEIKGLEGTMGYNEETALKNQVSLENNEYGKDVDFPLEVSRKIQEIGNVRAQDFLVLARFEVCDVTFERKLYFFKNNYQIVITLHGDEEQFIDAGEKYFEVNKENCGEEKIWNFEKQEVFYSDLVNKNAPEIIQTWFDNFDRIIQTIEFYEEDLSVKLEGRWLSLDDEKSVIEFVDNKKIDYYNDIEVSAGEVVLNDTGFIVNEGEDSFEYIILELNNNSLVLSYLPRGNTLRYVKE